MKKNIFNTISEIRPYFFSLREIKDRVSLDIKIPSSWEIVEFAGNIDEIGVEVKVQDKNSTTVLISVISDVNEEGYDRVFTVSNRIIRMNLDREEKETLFEEKVMELKKLFVEESLDKLKNITFSKSDNVRNRKSTKESGNGDKKGLSSDTEIQGENG